MKVVILNSGRGKRMLGFTRNKPKCLVELDGKTILGSQIENFMHYGLNEFVITTGYFGNKIKEFMSSNFPEAKVEYVYNPMYKSTNYIYSLFLARGKIKGDVMLLHGDMVFDKIILGKLLKSRKNSCAIVEKNFKAEIKNRFIKISAKDFKAEIKNKFIKRIGVYISGKSVFNLFPVYKLSKKDFAVWMNKIKELVKAGKVNIYAEEAFNLISGKIKIYPIYFKNELCMEIDDANDLNKARKYF